MSPAGEGGGDLLADQVVRQEEAAALRLGVEGEEQVLAVGRADRPLEGEAGGVGVEGLHDPGREAVAAGEDDALVVGQPQAGLPDAVEPDDGPGQRVEDEVPDDLFLVRADPDQGEGADDGVGDLGVGEGLQRFGDRLRVDAVGGLGVVLRLDGEHPAGRGDVQASAERDVRVPAGDVVVPGALRPVEVVRGREGVVALAPGVEEPGPAGRFEGPAQHPQVVRLLPGPEDGEEPVLDAPEPEQPRAPEVAVQRGELADEAGVVQEAGDRVPGQRVQVPVVQGEDVGDRRPLTVGGDRATAEEQDVVPDGDDVEEHPGAFGAEPVGAGEGESAGAEGGGAGGVEGLGAPGQFAGLRGEAVAEHRVRVLVDSAAHPCAPSYRGDCGSGAGHSPVRRHRTRSDRTPVAVSPRPRRSARRSRPARTASAGSRRARRTS